VNLESSKSKIPKRFFIFLIFAIFSHLTRVPKMTELSKFSDYIKNATTFERQKLADSIEAAAAHS
jgi:hypothetical protein